VDITDQVKAVIKNELKIPAERLSDDTKLEELGAESIDIIEIVYALEEKFDIDISVKYGQGDSEAGDLASSLSAFATLSDICRVVQTLVDAKAAR
jgi:acyl carrier protein